jgi:hypothetical protein
VKARNDRTTPPVGDLMRPVYVLQMNWWHWSDANRAKWLKELRTALHDTLHKVDREIARMNPRKLCGLDHHRGVKCPNQQNGCTW